MKLIAMCLLLAGVAFGQQSIFSGEDGVVAHLVDGDGWQTSIQLNNIDETPSQYKLSFFAENGTPQTLQTNFGTGTFIWGTIPGRGSVTIQTAGTKADLSQGWALMETVFVVPGTLKFSSGATVEGTVLFYRPPYVPRPTEASEPLDFSAEGRWVLPFDHLNGYSSGIAIVNHLTYADATVFVTIYDESGNQIALDSFTVSHGQHTAFTLTQKYPQTLNRRGTVRIETSAISINVLGLRFNPNGTISSTSPTSWF